MAQRYLHLWAGCMDHLLRNGSPVYVDRRPLEVDVLVVPEVSLRGTAFINQAPMERQVSALLASILTPTAVTAGAFRLPWRLTL